MTRKIFINIYRGALQTHFVMVMLGLDLVFSVYYHTNRCKNR